MGCPLLIIPQGMKVLQTQVSRETGYTAARNQKLEGAKRTSHAVSTVSEAEMKSTDSSESPERYASMIETI
jgi:hypothetical protein